MSLERAGGRAGGEPARLHSNGLTLMLHHCTVMDMQIDVTAVPATSAERLRWAEANGQRGIYRFGALPETYDYYGFRVSRNHRDGGYEEGVSVYEGWMVGTILVLDLRNVDAASALFIINADDVWQVRGTMLVATGSDGEPLMYDDGADKVLTASKVTVTEVAPVLV